MNPKKTKDGLQQHQDATDKNCQVALRKCVPTSELEQLAPPVKKQKAKDTKPRSKKRVKALAASESLLSGHLAAETDVQRSAHLGTILLVEDNPDDVFLVGMAFKKLGKTNPLVVVRDGEQAVQYFQGEGGYSDREQFPIPQLILLDLDIPGMNGFQVLTWLRQESEFRHLPMIILTISTYSPDVRRAYQLGANSCNCSRGSWCLRQEGSAIEGVT